MNTFNPKLHFQMYHKAEMELLAQNVNNRWFNLALEYALLSHNSTAEEMKGAKDFINTLLNLAETDRNEVFPVKKLEVLGQSPIQPKNEAGSKKQ